MNTLTDYLYAKAAKNHLPLGGTFELSPVCNFSCKMCYVRKTHEQIRCEGKCLRTPEEWLDLAKKCAHEGMLYLLLTGGEPFLYPGFKDLYIALHKMGLVLSINSNGTMIDEQTVAWLKEYAPSRINITLYGASEDTYQRICGNREGYHRAVKAIRLLLEAKIPVVINSSMIPENADDLEEIVKFGRRRKRLPLYPRRKRLLAGAPCALRCQSGSVCGLAGKKVQDRPGGDFGGLGRQPGAGLHEVPGRAKRFLDQLGRHYDSLRRHELPP